MKDLSTKEGRQRQFDDIEASLISSLLTNGIFLCPNAVCRVARDSVQIGIEKTGGEKAEMLFASVVTIYTSNGNEINFGSSGAFSPDNSGAYWRTIHAANILNNWAKSCEIINTHCQRYEALEEEVFNGLQIAEGGALNH